MEVWNFDECLVRTGTSSSGARLDTYAEDVSVSLTRSFKDFRDPETGQVTDRIESARDADMSIGRLFDVETAHTDGQPIRLYGSSASGTITYQLGSAYWSSKGWQSKSDGLVSHDVKFVGANFGTV